MDKEYFKEYYKTNKEKMDKYHKEYKENNPEYEEKSKKYHKEYYQKNREKMIKKSIEYRKKKQKYKNDIDIEILNTYSSTSYKILYQIYRKNEITIKEIIVETGLSFSTISNKLIELEEEGYVSKDVKDVKITKSGIKEMEDFLDKFYFDKLLLSDIW